MKEITRRSLLGFGVGSGAAFALAACAPPAERAPIAMPNVPATPRPPAMGGTRPELASSFGPNGTHYPVELPWIGSEAETELVAECDWESIAEQIGTLTAAQVEAGAVIRVRPGRLVGNGDTSAAEPVLAGAGDPSWGHNVLICPLEGYGSVTVEEAGIRIDTCHRLSIFGFAGTTVGLVLTECTDIQLGWGQWSAMGITRGGERIELYELVLGFRRDPQDTFGVRPTDSNAMTDIRRFGCTFGPSVKPDGNDAHCDTAQFEGTGNGTFGPLLSVDCVDLGSSNAVMLLHDAVTRADFEHCLVLGETLPWEVFPLQAGDYRGEPNAFSGGAQDVRISDSVVCGPIGRVGFTRVSNTVLSYEPQDSQRPSVEGSWTIDPSVSGWSADDILERTGTDYSAESLAELWSW